jgi:hypothetical protein
MAHGGRRGLPAGRLGGVDQGEGRALGLEEDEDPGDLDCRREGAAEDPEPVSLEEGEDVPDGLVPQAKAAALRARSRRRRWLPRGGDNRRRSAETLEPEASWGPVRGGARRDCGADPVLRGKRRNLGEMGGDADRVSRRGAL